ncbi:putative T7SS-secreted protein [Actinotalea subterranea]|uniref:putative T7SS-secreted protein n=1 Tax=Actinotalea subterranea TaxID=2607497 RepID=UPI00165DC00E|nr:hypothetical protein [Actinotalea subterranea]
MPDFTIDGNPAGIRASAATARTKGQSFVDIGDALARVTTDGWTGRAADAFRDALDTEPNRWRDAGQGFLTAAAALETFADALAAAQSAATSAQSEYERGDRVTDSARDAWQAETNRARQEAFDANPFAPLTLTPFHDPGEAIRDAAVASYEQARDTLDAAAQVCADGVRAGCTAAPEKRGWLESGLAFIGGVFVGAGEAIWDLLTIVPFSPVNMLQDSYALVTGDLTPEELAVKYRLSAEVPGQMLQALKDDPLEFGINLGKGLLDWDTWADDPARAIGHLVPDLIASVATGGAGGLATRGARGGADALDALGDIARAGNRLDDLGDLGRLDNLDDLGDLGRLDDLDDLGDLGRVDGADDLGDLGRVDDTGDVGRVDDGGAPKTDPPGTGERRPDQDTGRDADADGDVTPGDRTPDTDTPGDRTPDDDTPGDRTPDEDAGPDKDGDGDTDGDAETDKDGDADGEDGDPTPDPDADAEAPGVYPEYAGQPGFTAEGAIDPVAFRTEPDEAFFWSGRTDGIGGEELAGVRAAEGGGTTLERLMADRGIELPEWNPLDPNVQKMWSEASAAYANGVTGEVRAVVGAELREGNIWQNVELPRLIDNPLVTKITEIDPVTGIERVVYP